VIRAATLVAYLLAFLECVPTELAYHRLLAVVKKGIRFAVNGSEHVLHRLVMGMLLHQFHCSSRS
jgi:hypothetical protein